ncbi:MAG TPA: NfeD family protein [Pseudoalteromonas sp.]|jgi:membrane protein implicated in regulation of membrane protease activity|uniref:NfeD-like C-terminal domain-containing protein n=1 Tax=marine sediment metagenome TaxID=412755 RepID=A0A0F9P4G8_9ZZZZ|nr:MULTISPECIES: NfeD family protein [unclassified Pseudoalteromonas]HDY90528.1 NfeD family protein [Pseudoalteromonas sp.]HDZ32880.1 NfeD family protein [Pseudoalteromonas sp.]|tara:strand:+ start:990 stop:1445 length:456 start_codon:yes stop_codon:yes gene_type:complete
MDFITQNLPQTLMVLGIVALIIEVAVLGLSTFILLFFGLSLFLTGLLMSFGILPDSLTTALWSNTVVTAGLAVALWKPLKQMQNRVDKKQVNSDFAELTFVLTSDVTEQGLTTHQYSGISWKLKSEQPIIAGTEVVVTKKEVGVMWVTPKS